MVGGETQTVTLAPTEWRMIEARVLILATLPCAKPPHGAIPVVQRVTAIGGTHFAPPPDSAASADRCQLLPQSADQ